MPREPKKPLPPLPLWQREPEAELYQATPYAPLAIRLTEHATRELIELTLSKHDKETRYILIERGGMLRIDGYMFKKWANAVKYATSNNLAIYNARSKKTCRPVWVTRQYLQRRLAERTFEQVHLIPFLPAVANVPQRRLNAMFYLELENGES